MWMINPLLGECTAMQYANPTTMIWARVFVGFRPKLGQSLDLKYSEQLITTCLCKDDWTVRTSLTTAVHCGGSCTRHMFPAIRCKNLRSSCITLQYNVLQHLDTCCEQLTTVTTPKKPISRMMLMQRRTLQKLSLLEPLQAMPQKLLSMVKMLGKGSTVLPSQKRRKTAGHRESDSTKSYKLSDIQ